MDALGDYAGELWVGRRMGQCQAISSNSGAATVKLSREFDDDDEMYPIESIDCGQGIDWMCSGIGIFHEPFVSFYLLSRALGNPRR